MWSDNKEPINVSGTVPAGEMKKFEYVVRADCTLEGIFIRFYGTQMDLQVVPMIMYPDESYSPVIEFVGNGYLAGDDDRDLMDISKSLQKDDTIIFEVKNVSTDRALDFKAQMFIDMFAGMERVV